MIREEIFEKIKTTICGMTELDDKNLSNITEETEFEKDLGMTTFQVNELGCKLIPQICLSISNKDMRGMISISDLISHVLQKTLKHICYMSLEEFSEKQKKLSKQEIDSLLKQGYIGVMEVVFCDGYRSFAYIKSSNSLAMRGIKPIIF